MTWSILSSCFLFGMGSNLAGVWLLWNRTKALFFMGSNLAGVSVFSNLTLTRLWAAIVRNPRFERFFVLLGRGSTAAGVRVFRNRSLFFMGSKGDVKHSVCVFFAWRGLESCWCFWSFRIWRWRDFEQPSFGIHGVRVFRNRTKALFFIVFFFNIYF